MRDEMVERSGGGEKKLLTWHLRLQNGERVQKQWIKVSWLYCIVFCQLWINYNLSLPVRKSVKLVAPASKNYCIKTTLQRDTFLRFCFSAIHTHDSWRAFWIPWTSRYHRFKNKHTHRWYVMLAIIKVVLNGRHGRLEWGEVIGRSFSCNFLIDSMSLEQKETSSRTLQLSWWC